LLARDDCGTVEAKYETFMTLLSNLLPAVQVVLSLLLIGGILLQQRGAGLGGAFGGNDAGETYYTRRGAEKFLFQGTIIVAILFALSSFIALFI